jgi:LysR family transcriptional regulator, hydrogen peroxide-inducible genes activator
MTHPTLRQLAFLIAIADRGSFIGAADAAAVTQPTLSSGIKELEAALGVQLIERHRKGAELTAAGDIAVRHARQILSAMATMEEAVRGVGEPLSGPFRLGVIPTVAPFLLPAALPRIKTAFPKLSLFLREDLTGRLMDGLRSNSLDAALIALPWDSPGIATRALFDDEFLFIGPAGHPLSDKPVLSPDDLRDERVLLLEDGHCLRDHALGVCELARPGRDEVRATSLFTLVQMAAGGLGVSLLPKMAAESGIAPETAVVRRFDPPIVGRQIGLAWRKGSARSAEAELLGQVLRPQAA